MATSQQAEIDKLWEQCPGCPAGGQFYNPRGDLDGCERHSTAAYSARSRDAQMGGGNLPFDY